MIAWIPCKQLIFIFLNGQKTDSICSINKQINFSLGIITAWQDNWGKKLGSFGVFAHPLFFFLCVCVHASAETCLSACDHVCARLGVCVRDTYFVQNQSDRHKGVLCALCSPHWSCPWQKIITVCLWAAAMERGQHRHWLHFTASEDVTSPRKKRGWQREGEKERQ